MPLPIPGTVKPSEEANTQPDQTPKVLQQPVLGDQQEVPPMPTAGGVPVPPALNPAFQQQPLPVIPGSPVPPTPMTEAEVTQVRGASPDSGAMPLTGAPAAPLQPVATEVPPIPQQPVAHEDSPSMPFNQPPAQLTPQVTPQVTPQAAYAPPAPLPQQAPATPIQQPLAPAAPSGALQGTSLGGDVLQQLEQAGFAGLELGFGSFPTVRLQGESFSTSDGSNLGQTFACIIHGARPKYLLKCADIQNAEEFVYSYDRVTTTGGKGITQLIEIWKQKGWDNPVWKDYLDVTAQLVNVDRKELGEVVLLSIPKTSNSRFTGYLATLWLGEQLRPADVITQVYPGQKITSVKFPFHPWAFKKYDRTAQFFTR